MPGGYRISGVAYGEEAEKIRAGIDRFSPPALDDYRDAPLRRADGLAFALGIAAQADLTARDLEGTPYALGDLPRVRIQAGRARLFSAAQRQAMLRGRGRCQWRHCDNPWVEADHITRFCDGGRTSVDDGRMLCGFHHRLRHKGWVLTARADGTYHATPPPDWAAQRARAAADAAPSRRRTRSPRVA